MRGVGFNELFGNVLNLVKDGNGIWDGRSLDVLLDLHVRKFIHFRLTQEKLKKNSMKQAPAEEIERDLDVNGKLMAIQNDFARFVVNVGIELQNCGEAQQKRGA